MNSGNIAEPSGRHQLDTEDHGMISGNDEDQLYDNESDLNFLDTKMQCENKCYEAGLQVLDQIIEKFNAFKNGQEKLYAQFTSEHESLEIIISTLTKLRSRYCVLAGSSGTNNVCVCVHHENFKLMLNEINIQHLTKDTKMMLKDYYDSKDKIAKAFNEHSINEVRFEI